MDGWIQDLRLAARTLRRSPLFVVVACLTLGLGLGVNATIFTFVDAILLRPFPGERPEELLRVYTTWTREAYGTSSRADFLDLRDDSGAYDLFGHSMALASLERGGRSEVLVGEMVTGDAFATLGVAAARGRMIAPADDATPGAPRVVVLGHGLWQRRFGGDPDVVGRTARFNGETYEIVGVAPESFQGLLPGVASSFWMPSVRVDEIDAAGQINSEPNDPGTTLRERRGYRWLWLAARPAPGVSASRVATMLESRMAALAAAYPVTNREKSARVLPADAVRFHPEVDRVLGPVATVLLLAVGLVLLVVCANLANMVLARAESRRREVAVRLALGAGRWRLLRQATLESLLISAGGLVVALGLARATTALLLAHRPPLPFAIDLGVAIDGRVVLFTAALAALSALVFGLLPALQASRPALVPALKAGGRTSGGAARPLSLKGGLVVAQVAVSTVLLVGAALLLRGLATASAIDVGLDPGRVAVLNVNLAMNGYDDARSAAFFRSLRERAAALPGVAAAAVATRVPFDVNLHQQAVVPDVLAGTVGDDAPVVDVSSVDPQYFATLGVPLLQGRAFDDRDRPGAPRVAIVSAAMAERWWGEVGVVGRRLRLGGADGPEAEIVGVAADYKVRTVGELPRPMVHLARAQSPGPYGTLLARTAGGDATRLAAALRTLALELDPELGFGEPTTLRGLTAVSLYPVRAGSLLLGLFGVLALVLASVGLYGVVATGVARRHREIGVRLAMGARPASIVRLVLRGGFVLVAVGMAVGVALAAAGGRLLAGVLYGTSGTDPLAFAGALALLLTVALLANLLPARRASRLDPIRALREE